MEFFYFFGKDHSSTSTKDFDMSRTFFLQQVMHIFKVFGMPTLVRGHGNRIGIFLDCTVHHFFHATVMTKMDHFHPGGLDNAPHDVYGCVMAVKKGCCSYNSYFIFGFIRSLLFHS